MGVFQTTRDNASLMEKSISCVRFGANPSETSISSHVGNGSSAQDVVGNLVMRL